MTKPSVMRLMSAAQSLGIYVKARPSPEGDGWRYKFSAQPEHFAASDGLFIARDMRSAWAFIAGYEAASPMRVEEERSHPF